MMWDKGFDSNAFLAAVTDTGAQVLGRLRSNRRTPALTRLVDGSYLSVIGTVKVRVIDAQIAVTCADGTSYTGFYRLETTLADARRYLATALVGLYHQRYEHKSAYYALRHTIMNGRNLRSGDPAGIEQEMWSLLTLYQSLRTVMVDAADPDRPSPAPASTGQHPQAHVDDVPLQRAPRRRPARYQPHRNPPRRHRPRTHGPVTHTAHGIPGRPARYPATRRRHRILALLQEDPTRVWQPLLPDGTLRERDRGTPQGSAVSPVLANLFLHYALDAWMARPSRPWFERYVDAAVVHCVSERQARFVPAAIRKRMAEVGPEPHPEKTRTVYCQDDNRCGSHEHTEFTFLGHTFRERSVRRREGGTFRSFQPAISSEALRRTSAEVRSWRLHHRTSLSEADLARKAETAWTQTVARRAKFFAHWAWTAHVPRVW